MNVHTRLEEERKRLGKGQEEMAASGLVKLRTYANYASGFRVPDADFLSAIAAAGADVQYILTGTRSMPVLRMDQERAGYVVEILSPAEQRALDALRASGALQPSTINQTITAPAGQVAAGNHINQKQGAANVGTQSGGRRRR